MKKFIFFIIILLVILDYSFSPRFSPYFSGAFLGFSFLWAIFWERENKEAFLWLAFYSLLFGIFSMEKTVLNFLSFVSVWLAFLFFRKRVLPSVVGISAFQLFFIFFLLFAIWKISFVLLSFLFSLFDNNSFSVQHFSAKIVIFQAFLLTFSGTLFVWLMRRIERKFG